VFPLRFTYVDQDAGKWKNFLSRIDVVRCVAVKLALAPIKLDRVELGRVQQVVLAMECNGLSTPGHIGIDDEADGTERSGTTTCKKETKTSVDLENNDS
jgi:hypothetical protein